MLAVRFLGLVKTFSFSVYQLLLVISLQFKGFRQSDFHVRASFEHVGGGNLFVLIRYKETAESNDGKAYRMIGTESRIFPFQYKVVRTTRRGNLGIMETSRMSADWNSLFKLQPFIIAPALLILPSSARSLEAEHLPL